MKWNLTKTHKMKNAQKTEFILDLEKGTPSPLDEILSTESIVERSKQRLDAETNQEMLRIANDNHLTLKNNWSEVYRIYKMNNLNR